jgi:hypothetical protein
MVGLEGVIFKVFAELPRAFPATSSRQASAGRPPASATTAVEASGGMAIRRPVDVHVSTSPSDGGSSRRSTPPTRPRSSQTPQAYVGRSPRADDSAGSSWPTRREDARRRLGRSFPIGLIPLGPRRRSGGPSPETHGALPSKGSSLTVLHADRAGVSQSTRRSGEHRLYPGLRSQTAQSEAASSVGGVFKVTLNSSYGCRGG